MRETKCYFHVEAEHGDYGESINKITFTTDYRLTPGNLPDVSKAIVNNRFITTESWACIHSLDDWNSDYYDEEDGVEPESFAGLFYVFSTDYGEAEKLFASYEELQAALKQVVVTGVYKEVTYHKAGVGKETEFVYELDKNLFKSK